MIVTCGDDGVTQIPVTVPIDDIEVENDPDHSQEIKLNSEYTLKMKYPSLETLLVIFWSVKTKMRLKNHLRLWLTVLIWYMMMRMFMLDPKLLRRKRLSGLSL